MQAVIDAIGNSHGGGKWKSMVLVDDRIADSIFQQIQTRPQEYSILATLNLNGDYTDAAAMVTGRRNPGANIGEMLPSSKPPTAPPRNTPAWIGSTRLGDPQRRNDAGVSGLAAAGLVTKGLSAAIADKQVTYDLARLMEPKVEPVSCSGFAEAIIQRF